jgi:hypothetical protein
MKTLHVNNKHTFISRVTACSERSLHLQLHYICVLCGILLQHALSMLVLYIKAIHLTEKVTNYFLDRVKSNKFHH